MTETDPFGEYAEALSALATVEERERGALRKAVETAGAAGDQAKTRISDQQRMYDRAAREVAEVDQLLVELHEMLGVSRAGADPPSQPTGPPPALSELRSRIDAVARWAAESKPIAESLLRTRARLARSPEPAAPAAEVPPAASKVSPFALVAAAILAVVIAIVVLALIAR